MASVFHQSVFANMGLIALREDRHLALSVAAGTDPVYVALGPVHTGVCTGFLTLTELAQNKPAGTHTRYQVSVDRCATWLWYTGGAWVTAADDGWPGDFSEANTPEQMAEALPSLEVPTGVVWLRLWMKRDGAQDLVIESVKLDWFASFPQVAAARPAQTDFDADTAVVITVSDGGIERRRQKRPAPRRKVWNVSWDGLTMEEKDALKNWNDTKTTLTPWLWENPNSVSSATGMGDVHLVRFLEPVRIEAMAGAAPFFRASAALVEVAQ